MAIGHSLLPAVSLVFVCPGVKFWRGTRKITAVKEGEHPVYLGFHGKGKHKAKQHAVVPPVIASDSDSDFEFVAKKNVGQSKKFDTLSIRKAFGKYRVPPHFSH